MTSKRQPAGDRDESPAKDRNSREKLSGVLKDAERDIGRTAEASSILGYLLFGFVLAFAGLWYLVSLTVAAVVVVVGMTHAWLVDDRLGQAKAERMFQAEYADKIESLRQSTGMKPKTFRNLLKKKHPSVNLYYQPPG